MSPLGQFGLSILGLTTVSTGIGVTIASLSNTKINLLDLKEKFEKLIEKIENPIWNQEDSFYKKAAQKKKDLKSRIDKVTDLSKTVLTFKDPNNDSENQKKLKEIWQEIDEIFQLLGKAKKIEKTSRNF